MNPSNPFERKVYRLPDFTIQGTKPKSKKSKLSSDRTQAPVNRKIHELPAFEVNYQFPKSVRKSAKKGMKNLNLKSSRKAKK